MTEKEIMRFYNDRKKCFPKVNVFIDGKKCGVGKCGILEYNDITYDDKTGVKNVTE
jgi:hypothetical protein